MSELQTNKVQINQHRIVETQKPTIKKGEVLVKIDRCAFTSNNVSYAVVAEQIRYWEFFPAQGSEAQNWGIIPTWGFADVVESNSDELPVGERLFGYFPSAQYLAMTPANVADLFFIEASEHRTTLPPAYNFYRRVNHEPNYDSAKDNVFALLYVLHLTSFIIHNLFKTNNWFGAEQIVIISASSKTSTGLAYGLSDDDSAPHTIGLTSKRNLDFVKSINAYNSVGTYDDLSAIDTSKPTAIVDMSGDTDVLSRLHISLGDNMRYCCNVGCTHWDVPSLPEGIIQERSHFFFAPGVKEQLFDDAGVDNAVFEQLSNDYIEKTIGKTLPWLEIVELNGVEGLGDIYSDICNGNISPNQGLIVKN